MKQGRGGLYWQSPDSGGTGSRTPVRKQDVEGKDTGTRPRTGRLPSPTFILPSAPRLALTPHTSLSWQRPGGDVTRRPTPGSQGEDAGWLQLPKSDALRAVPAGATVGTEGTALKGRKL